MESRSYECGCYSNEAFSLNQCADMEALVITIRKVSLSRHIMEASTGRGNEVNVICDVTHADVSYLALHPPKVSRTASSVAH